MTRTHRNPNAWFDWNGRRRDGQTAAIPSYFKRLMSRIRRAKDADSMRNDKEPECWKKTDEWDWW